MLKMDGGEKERVFHDYDLVDLPVRNEGKLKAYGSCTDTRAWSHFSSDKSENLVEIIKRNNDRCAPKYVPTKVIVETLMVTKNAEITRLKRKLCQFEQILAAYDQLDLTCAQRCEIEKAHESIKAANKDLDDMYLDLDMSGYTEGIDSEAFETGKSRPDSQMVRGDESHMIRGDEWSFDTENKVECCCRGVQYEAKTENKSTDVTDPRINEMQEVIICKDAKLSAMRNTIAVMENDVCEPYCVYAHIYTALEKIYSTLYQHEKYKEYIDLLVNGNDTRNLDIKGKIYFKMKVLEKLCLALIAPCSNELENREPDCSCFRAEVVTRIETTYALTAPEAAVSPIDEKRIHLVADIMENTEMKEILSKSSGEEHHVDDNSVNPCDIDICLESENLQRLKQLQANYDELMECYENVKHERICLQLRCSRYNELEYELEKLRLQAKEYNALWNEKEYYRKRSEDTDELREKYLILYEESTNLDTQLKAEMEIHSMKSDTIADLRSENIALEKKLNEASILFEKGYNTLQCKLKETECKCMCYDEQVRSLSSQIDRLLEQEHDQQEEKKEQYHIYLLNEVENLKEQLKNLQDLLCSSEDEKKTLQDQFKADLELINDLKMKIEAMKSTYDRTCYHNNVLESHAQQMKEDIDKLSKENHELSLYLQEKENAVENLHRLIETKSLQIEELNKDLENQKHENQELMKNLNQDKQNNESIIEDMTAVNSKLLRTTEELNYFKSLLDGERRKSVNLEDDLNKNKNIPQELEKLKQLYEDNLSKKSELEDAFNKQCIKLENYTRNENKLLDQQKQNKELILMYEKEIASMKEDLENKNIQLKSLLESVNAVTEESLSLKNEAQKVPHLEQQLQKTLNEALYEKQQMQANIKDINNLNRLLEDKSKENERLLDEISILKLKQSKSLDTFDAILKENQIKSDSIAKERQHLQKCSEQNDNLLSALTKAKQTLNEIKTQKEILNKEFENCKQALKTAEEKNMELYDHNNNLLINNEILENALISARNEIKLYTESTKEPCESLCEEIKLMKNEKLECHAKIRELHDRLDETENLITLLNEDLLARDDKLAIQQNHINELEYELRQLHENLEMAVGVSEEIKDNTEQKIDLSLKKMEAHHSKATHNMKMELAMLENHKSMLEEQLSTTQLKTKQSIKDNNDQLSNILQLYNEREIIATEIKQLELMTSDDTMLSPKNCDVHQILASIDNIRKFLDKTTNESSNLEQTLLKVRTSSQLLLSKADEAKRIIETEKSKILTEKEEAIKDRQRLEKRLTDIKTNLEKQIADDKILIRDLNAELLNHKLIIDEINKSSETYKNNLNEEIEKLKESYSRRINEYELKIKELSEENNKNCDVIKKVTESLKEKSDDVSKLQNQLAKIKSKEFNNMETQSIFTYGNIKNSKTQTDLKQPTVESNINEIQDKSKAIEQNDKYSNILNVNKAGKERRRSSPLPQNNSFAENNVQILTAQVEPTFNALELVKKSYHNYKINRLSLGPIEQQSIASLIDPKYNMNSMVDEKKSKYQPIKSHKSTNDANIPHAQKYVYQDPQISNNGFEISTKNAENIPSNNNIDESEASTENKELFYILKDSDPNLEEKTRNNISISKFKLHDDNTNNLFPENAIVESMDIQPPHIGKSHDVIGTDFVKNFSIQNTKINNSDDHPKVKTDKKAKNKSTEIINNSKAVENIYKAPDSTSLISVGEVKSLDSYMSGEKSRSTFVSVSDSNIVSGHSRYEQKVSPEDANMSLKVIYPPFKLSKNKNTPMVKNKVDLDSRDSKIKNKYVDKTPNKLQNKIGKKKVSASKNKLVDRDLLSTKLISHPKNFEGISDKTKEKIILITNEQDANSSNKSNVREKGNLGLQFIVDTLKQELEPQIKDQSSFKDKTDDIVYFEETVNTFQPSRRTNQSEFSSDSSSKKYPPNYSVDKGVMAKEDTAVDNENKIQFLTQVLENLKRDSKRKIEEIKLQYDSNIRHIINEHDEGVRSLQSLHEETLHDILNGHENEVENLRSMSIEALRRLDKLEKEKQSLTNGLSTNRIEQEPIRIKHHKQSQKILTKTNVQSFDVTPKIRRLGPCTCTMSTNTIDTYRKMFEQVDGDKRKLAEQAYMKFICNKLLSDNYETLDTQELSFLHFKVCRIWKLKIQQEEALQQRIHSLESEVMAKQRHAYEYIAELDRQVAEENRRLQEVREAVCLQSDYKTGVSSTIPQRIAVVPHSGDLSCNCVGEARLLMRDKDMCSGEILKCVRAGRRPKRIKPGTDKPVLASIVKENRIERRTLTDEFPTRLRRVRDKTPPRLRKKGPL